jgi:hypothetical protein
MASLIDDIRNGGRWVSCTFKGDQPTRNKQDIPMRMALWLFRVGTIWAALLFPVTVVFSFTTVVLLFGLLEYGKSAASLGSGIWVCPYLLSGYAVWIGWGWRSRQTRSVFMSASFWFASAGFSAVQPIRFWMESHEFWIMLYPNLLWSIVVVVASLAGVALELMRYKNKRAA